MSTEDKDKEKKKRRDDENGDPFWSRILIFTIVVVWVALVAGNWIGHYIIQSGVLAKKTTAYGSEFKEMPAAKPKPWKMPVKVIDPKDGPEKEFDAPDFDGKSPSPSPAADSSPSPKPTEKPADKPSPTPTATKTSTPTPTPTVTHTPTPEPTPEPSPSPAPRPSPKPSPAPKPTPRPRPTSTPTAKPKPTPTAKPTPSPAPKVTATPTVKPTPAATPQDTGSYSLQAGNFNKEENAVERVNILKGKGYSAMVVKVGDRYKVYVGSYGSKDKANEVTEKLRQDGFDTFVVSD